MVKVRKSNVENPPESCPLTACMNFIGGSWTPNIIWYLSKGPRRFSELRGDLKTVAPKVLSDKLKKMESSGLLTRTIQPTSPPTVEYDLTDLGHEMLPIIQAIVKVGHRIKSRKAK